MARPTIVGPDSLESPYPLQVSSQIEGGFGRGSAELGIPTANIPPQHLAALDTGVYYGWVRVSPHHDKNGQIPASIDKKIGERTIAFNFGARLDPSTEINVVFPMVMSIGWNPFYNNQEKSAEIHILHKFAHQFYGANISVSVTGFIRPEQKYDSLDALIADIQTDISVAQTSLDRPAYQAVKYALQIK